MSYDDLSALTIDVTDGVATVTIDHPPLNLMDGVLLPSLRAFIARVRDDAASASSSSRAPTRSSSSRTETWPTSPTRTHCPKPPARRSRPRRTRPFLKG